MYLLDTNVVSELRRPRPHGAVVAWTNSAGADELFICAVTVGEIQAGIEITREQDTEKARELTDWLDRLVAGYDILPMDAAAFRAWARIRHRRSDTLVEDAMIAAVAVTNGLTVATRNTRDFAALGISSVDPFAYRPA